jgi:hypothetical protein
MKPKTSPEPTVAQPKDRTAGETENGRDDRDLAVGEGGTIEVPAKPGDISKDD